MRRSVNFSRVAGDLIARPYNYSRVAGDSQSRPYDFSRVAGDSRLAPTRLRTRTPFPRQVRRLMINPTTSQLRRDRCYAFDGREHPPANLAR